MSVCGDRVPVITETRDNNDVVVNTAQPGVVSSSVRQRRKIERNTSAPLPGMLQVTFVSTSHRRRRSSVNFSREGGYFCRKICMKN